MLAVVAKSTSMLDKKTSKCLSSNTCTFGRGSVMPIFQSDITLDLRTLDFDNIARSSNIELHEILSLGHAIIRCVIL